MCSAKSQNTANHSGITDKMVDSDYSLGAFVLSEVSLNRRLNGQPDFFTAGVLPEQLDPIARIHAQAVDHQIQENLRQGVANAYINKFFGDHTLLHIKKECDYKSVVRKIISKLKEELHLRDATEIPNPLPKELPDLQIKLTDLIEPQQIYNLRHGHEPTLKATSQDFPNYIDDTYKDPAPAKPSEPSKPSWRDRTEKAIGFDPLSPGK